MKKVVLIGVVVLFAGLVFSRCATQSGSSSKEVWTNISSIDAFIGKWEGSKDIPIPRNAETTMPETVINFGIYFEYANGDKEVTGSMKIDLDRFLTDWLTDETIKEAELSKDDLWDLLVKAFNEMEGFEIGGKYFVNYNLSGDTQTFFLANSEEKFQINKSGDKLRLIFSQPLSFGLGDAGVKEMIMERK